MVSVDFISRSGQHLGSKFEITIPKGTFASKDQRVLSEVFDKCFKELERIEGYYSRFLDGSTLSAVNSRLGEWHEVSEEFVYLLKKAEEFHYKTEGNFDITLKSSLESLGYDKDYSFVRKPLEKKGVLSKLKSILVNPVRIDVKNHRIFLNKQIEIGGFGKGYCLDRLSDIIEGYGITDYYINAGGDILARKNDVNDGWDILLEHPDDTERTIGQIKLNGKAIAGSAPNRRRWGNYHHLLNAKTGMPQDSVKCIFVIASSGIEADAYSTALFTVGFDEAIDMVHKLPVDMLIVSKNNKMYKTNGFEVEIFS